jgi:cytochrome c
VNRLNIASIAAIACAASLLLARIHPFGDAGLYAAHAAQPPILERASVPPEVRTLLTAKCANCHSSQTHSPLYGHFAPMSWLMERDIVEGRGHMDLSRWDSDSPEQQETLKAKIVQQARSRNMPPLQYRLVHWDARITAAEIQALSQWARDASSSAAEVDAQATALGDPVRGQAVFEKRCTGCHALTENHEGPRLDGVYGRTAGAVAGFPYSAALKNAKIAWDDRTLEKWLTDPDAFLPGNNMDFHVPKAQERRDIIAWFKQR